MHHRFPVAAALTTAFYAAPQVPDDARRLFDAACGSANLMGHFAVPLRPSRNVGSALVLAREWGYAELEAHLVEAIDASYEPTWQAHSGEFTYGMGLNEPHPRGQFNAFLAAGEAAGPGSWTRLSAAPLERCPQVVGVDFPAVALSRAEWCDGVLHMRFETLRDDAAAVTSFRVVGVPPGDWTVRGHDSASVTRELDSLTVTLPLVHADVEIVRSTG